MKSTRSNLNNQLIVNLMELNYFWQCSIFCSFFEKSIELEMRRWRNYLDTDLGPFLKEKEHFCTFFYVLTLPCVWQNYFRSFFIQSSCKRIPFFVWNYGKRCVWIVNGVRHVSTSKENNDLINREFHSDDNSASTKLHERSRFMKPIESDKRRLDATVTQRKSVT